MKVVFLDVEQGDSTLVMLDDGTSILVDCNFTDDHICTGMSAHRCRK